MKSLSSIWSEVESWATREGVLQVGMTALAPLEFERFREWLEAGHHGSMQYLERHAEIRRNPGARYPWARSAIVITVPYGAERPSDGSMAAHIARYAQGDDYHEVIDRMLQRLELVVESVAEDTRTWRYVDTGPLSDRALAAAAGLGWIGRNSMLINETHGSWFFIGVLLTSLEPGMLSATASDRCGTCTRCVDACPTDAILPGRQVDSNRCISHATIEQRGELAPWMLESLGSNVFGCDICQEVCPWNRRPPEGHAELAPREVYRARPVTDLLRMDQSDFSATFRHSAVKRTRRVGMLRNAIAALAPDLTSEELVAACGDEDPGVAAAARLELERRGQTPERAARFSRSDDT